MVLTLEVGMWRQEEDDARRCLWISPSSEVEDSSRVRAGGGGRALMSPS